MNTNLLSFRCFRLKSKVSILYVIGSYSVGGAELSILKLCREIDKDFFISSIIALDSSGPLLSSFRECGTNIFYAPSIQFPAVISKYYIFKQVNAYINIILFSFYFVIIINLFSFSILNFFLPLSYVIGGLSSFLTFKKIKRVMSRRSQNIYMKSKPMFAKVELFLHNYMDAITGNSKRVLDELLSEGSKAERTHLIYNGVNSKIADTAPNRNIIDNLNIPSESLIITMVANLIPYKGHNIALEALGLFSQSYSSDWRCIFVGRDDGIQASLEELAVDLNIDSNILFLGSVSQVFDVYKSSDIALLTSFEEGFSNSILEAMICSLPLVVTDVGGNSEAVIHDYNGYVSNPGDSQSIARQILALANNSELRNSFGKNSIDRAINSFSTEDFISSYSSLFKSLINP